MIDKLAHDIAALTQVKLAALTKKLQLLNPITFSSAIASAGEHIKNLSTTVSKYLGKEKANEFLKSIDSRDYDLTNGILNNVVNALTNGGGSYYDALDNFGSRFSKTPGFFDSLLSAYKTSDKIRILNKYMPQILDTINMPVPSLSQRAAKGGAIGAASGAGIGGAVGLYKVLKNRHNYNQNMLNKIKGVGTPSPAPTILGDLKTIGKNMAGYGAAGGALGAVGGIARKGTGIKYSDKDRDLMTLAHTLSTIYDKTDAYLKPHT